MAHFECPPRSKQTKGWTPMATTLPRLNVTFERPTYEVLQRIANAQRLSLSGLVARLVESALDLAEDLSLSQIAEERLASFRRDDALSSKIGRAHV